MQEATDASEESGDTNTKKSGRKKKETVKQRAQKKRRPNTILVANVHFAEKKYVT